MGDLDVDELRCAQRADNAHAAVMCMVVTRILSLPCEARSQVMQLFECLDDSATEEQRFEVGESILAKIFPRLASPEDG